ncbi:MAG TPA: signal peptide peptidase SppA [Steroidobacteraceae bacterium]|nr:signal peptide peptidase SppA [Steroidobacteraceae bacterium]
MNVLRSVLRGIWRGLDGLRKGLHLLLLLAILGVIVGALRASIPRIPDTAALVIKPEGELVEQLSGEPLQRAVSRVQGAEHSETLLWDLVDAIHGAVDDRRIKVLVLDLDEFAGADGLPPLQELAHAIREFRASGKKVIAYGTAFMRDQYYLAAQADEVYLDPMGYVLIEGYGHYPLYFKSALDKLDVDLNVFRVGQYKSAVEEFTRDDMSPQDREQSTAYLAAMWSAYQQDLTAARHLEPGAIDRYVNSLAQATAAADNSTAEAALRAGLVTGLKSKQEVEQRLIDLVGEDDSTGSFHAVSSDDYVRFVHGETSLGRRDRTRIGVIVASGDILDGDQPPGTIGGDSTARLIREARLDEKIRAVVLRVDSPGGGVAASAEIYREIKALEAAGKPVVVSMGSLAASGGYYISAPANEIWASPATLTGSIGIFALVPTINRTLGKVGVGVDGVGTTPFSGQLQLERPLNSEARAFLEDTVDHGYDEFVAHVAAGRHMTAQQVNAVGQGRVWSGADAVRIGLVNHLGSFDDAVKAAARLAKVSQYKIQFIQPEVSWAEALALSVETRAARILASAFVSADPGMRSATLVAQRLDPLTREVERLSRFMLPNRLYAYCFCSTQ